MRQKKSTAKGLNKCLGSKNIEIKEIKGRPKSVTEAAKTKQATIFSKVFEVSLPNLWNFFTSSSIFVYFTSGKQTEFVDIIKNNTKNFHTPSRPNS